MEKFNQNGHSALGADGPKSLGETVKVEVDLPKIVEWVKNDLVRAMSLLNAIHSDPDLINAVSEFMYGRLINHKNQEALKNQTKLDL